ncbi:hypothetical protein GPJ56_010830 [Histomonas meleagridis]|uniref:uncharacterized protein n=1 Tax=Histomonas meleagridis TaxID=135588 RepID=UPI0035596949|nr:hypothetical protein GPJ56_010830 [Histomonas meleagridis]KAH0803748.1 hypothetical protein GO595_003522 [Histomonas meleagridis]
MTKRIITLNPQEKKKIEVRYIPTCLGTKENALIIFKSNEIGDFSYKLNGTGKPPQPQSPIIVTSPVNTTSSALVTFTNPFPYPTRFSISMSNDCEDGIFSFLIKRKVFTLHTFGEEFQIPFTFIPPRLGQFQAHIIIASLGYAKGPLPELETVPSIQFLFPIIGNSLIDNLEILTVQCRANEVVKKSLSLSLVGESDDLEASEYVLDLTIPSGYDFLKSIFEIKPSSIQKVGSCPELNVSVVFTPHRPLQLSLPLKVRNKLGQEWQFHICLDVDRGDPISTITIESLLNKTGTAKVVVPFVFHKETPFHAYFVQGSAAELSVQPEKGIIEPTPDGNETTELPITVVFAPKMYGKLLKGLLVIDTLDSQNIINVIGKNPEYVPPVVKTGIWKLEMKNELAQNGLTNKKKRNIVKENIESVRVSHNRNKN